PGRIPAGQRHPALRGRPRVAGCPAVSRRGRPRGSHRRPGVEAAHGRLIGRKPTTPNAVARLRARRQKSGRVLYYYDHGHGPDGKRREEPLGADYGLAIKRWAEIEHDRNPPAAAVLTFRHVADRYRVEVIPTKAPRTQKDNA